jgi:heat shock protein HslJ
MRKLPLHRTLLIGVFALVTFTACTATEPHQDAPPPPPAPASALPLPAPSPAAQQPPAAPDAALTGTAWRLVEILSMDDHVFRPRNPARYTLALFPDGSATVLADCNHGAGTWTSEGASQLHFGPLATTRMKCSPDSLSERYLAQFEWIRTYVLKDGHLFLATMADGAIIEFEPVTEP